MTATQKMPRLLPARLQSLVDGLNRRSNAYYVTVVHDRIRARNVFDMNWYGKTQHYADLFARLTGLVAEIDWATGEIWLRS